MIEAEYNIIDYPDFDSSKHIYIVATISGYEWIAYPPISEAIAKDIARTAPENDNECLGFDWDVWIEYLYVKKHDLEVARFNLKSWEWETP